MAEVISKLDSNLPLLIQGQRASLTRSIYLDDLLKEQQNEIVESDEKLGSNGNTFGTCHLVICPQNLRKLGEAFFIYGLFSFFPIFDHNFISFYHRESLANLFQQFFFKIYFIMASTSRN